MAFALFHESTASASNSPTTSHTVSYPATVNDDDFLLFIGQWNANNTITLASGWTRLGNDALGSPGTIEVWARIAPTSNTLGGTTFTITSSASQAAAFEIRRYSGTLGGLVAGTDYDISTGSGWSNTTTPDPDGVTATWGSDDNTFVALGGGRGDNDVASAAPTDYGNLTTSVSTNGGGGGAEVYSADRSLAAATDNPGTFTLPGTERVFAYTLVIAPGPEGTVAIGQAVETDTALEMGIGPEITETVGIATETDTALAVTTAIGAAPTNVVVEWDFDNDGDYDQAVEDITGFATDLSLRVGRDYPSQLTGRSVPGRLALSLDNSDDRFSIFNTASPVNSGAFSLKSGRRIRLRSAASVAKDPVLLARDRFDGAGPALGSAEVGGSWTAQTTATFTRGSGLATAAGPVLSSGVNHIATLDLGQTDYYVQTIFTDRDASNDVGVVYRYTDDDNYGIVVNRSTQLLIIDRVAGVNSTIGALSVERRPNVAVGALVAGSSVTAYWDGVPLLTGTTSLSAGDNAGIRALWASQRAPAVTEFFAWDDIRRTNPGYLFTGSVDDVAAAVTKGRRKTASVTATGDLIKLDREIDAPSSIGEESGISAGVTPGVAIGNVVAQVRLIHPPHGIDAGDTTLGAFGFEARQGIALARRFEEAEIGFLYEPPEGGVCFDDRTARTGSTVLATFSDAPTGDDYQFESITPRNRRRDIVNRVSARISPRLPRLDTVFGTDANNATSVVTHVEFVIPFEAPHADNAEVGDLIICPIASTVRTAGVSWLNPAGFTNLREAGDELGRQRIYAKRLAAGDFGATVRFYDDTDAAGGAWHAQVFLIKSWYGVIASGLAVAEHTGVGAPHTTTEANAGDNDPPVLFTPWPITPTLFITMRAGMVSSGSGATVEAASDTNAPNGYTNMRSTFIDATAAGAAFDVAQQRAVLSATEPITDPSPFGGDFDDFDHVEAVTIAVRGFAGDPPQTSGGQIIVANNAASQLEHDAVIAHQRPATILANETAADAYNNAILTRFDQDRPIVTLSYTANRGYRYRDLAAALRLSDRVTVTADGPAGLGIDEDFFIEAIRHTIDRGMTRWRVEYDLSPVLDPGGGAD